MKKPIIICVIVVMLVVVLNTVTQGHTDTVLGELDSKLDLVKERLLSKEDNESINGQIDKIMEEWQEKSKILAYYIEHNELEKVDMYLWEANINIETGEYNMALQALDTCKYIITHIKEKYKFSLKNIF